MGTCVDGDKLKNERLAWWREARFGMFIHWGLYSVPAGEWKGAEVPGISEWIMAQAKIPLAEYRRLADSFNPVDFDADFIAKLAKDAGMRYLVFTAKHHDGFAMYRSGVDKYNIYDATPFKRDPVAELAMACKSHGIVFCIYYSQDLDWAHPDGGGNVWDFEPSSKCFDRYMEEKCIPQLRELLTNYGKLGLIWFDMASNITLEQSRRIRELVHELQPECLVSGRVGHNMGDYGSLGDNQMPLGTPKGDWETPATLNNSWGYKAKDNNWRKAEDIICAVADLAEKGVNYLLNIGPDSFGRVPPQSVDILEKVGRWMSRNSEAIYGASPNPFDCEFNWGAVTSKGKNLYLLFSEWPGRSFMLPGLLSSVETVGLVGKGLPEIGFEVGNEGGTPVLSLNLPETAPDSPGSVVRIGCSETPRVISDCCQQADGELFLPPHRATVHRHSRLVNRKPVGFGGAIMAAIDAEANNDVSSGVQMGVGPSGFSENWYSPDDYLSWQCRLFQPGSYEVQVMTMARKYAPWKGGHKVEVTVGNHSISGSITDDGRITSLRNHHFEEAITRLGNVRIENPGAYDVFLKAKEICDDVEHGLCVSAVRLCRNK